MMEESSTSNSMAITIIPAKSAKIAIIAIIATKVKKRIISFYRI